MEWLDEGGSGLDDFLLRVEDEGGCAETLEEEEDEEEEAEEADEAEEVAEEEEVDNDEELEEEEGGSIVVLSLPPSLLLPPPHMDMITSLDNILVSFPPSLPASTTLLPCARVERELSL